MRQALHQVPILLLLTLFTAASAVAGQVELISKVHPQLVADTGSGLSEAQSISADGRYAVFLSKAPNLIPGQIDRNFRRDVFVHDRVTGTTELASRSVDSPTTAGNAESSQAAISRNGRYVVFSSKATDLVPGQQDSSPFSDDIFLYDRINQTTELVSHASSSRTQTSSGYSRNPAISADGRYVAFVSFADDFVEGQVATYRDNVWLYDRISGKNELVSHASGSALRGGNQDSYALSLSADGRFVAFQSFASDLVAGQRDTNGQPDTFLYDRISKQITLVSHASSSPLLTTVSGSGPSPAVISAGGSTVVFESGAANLVPGQRSVAGRTNVFAFHRPTGKTTLVSHAASSLTTAADGISGTFAVSADGSVVAFSSQGSNHVSRQAERARRSFDVFLYSRATGRIALASGTGGSPTVAANAPSALRGLSADGSRVLLQSAATDLARDAADANGTTDVFLHDRRSGRTELVSHRDDALLRTGNGESNGSILSADGRWVAFRSAATDLASGVKDLNQSTDVFLDGGAAGRELVSLRAPDLPSDTPQADSLRPLISADGRFVVFTSTAAVLVAGQRDTNRSHDVFLHDRALGTTHLVSRSAASPSTTGNAGSYGGALSADGLFVVFQSLATDLVPGSAAPPDDVADLFLYDRQTGSMTRIGRTLRVQYPPPPAPVISADGSFVAFVSTASDLVPGQIDDNGVEDVFLYDRAAGTTTLISRVPGTAATAGENRGEAPVLSADGRFIAFQTRITFPVYPLLFQDTFLHDRVTGTTTLVSRAADSPTAGVGGTSHVLSPDGRFVAFRSTGTNLVPGQVDRPGTLDLFVYDRLSGVNTLVTHTQDSSVTAAGDGFATGFSADGRFLTFSSSAKLAPGQPDFDPGYSSVFLFDRETGAITLVSPGASTAEGPSTNPRISADGRIIAFETLANYNPYESGTFLRKIFLHDRITGETVLANPSFLDPTRAAAGDVYLYEYVLSANGNHLAFTSTAWDLTPRDCNVYPFEYPHISYEDVFVYVRP